MRDGVRILTSLHACSEQFLEADPRLDQVEHVGVHAAKLVVAGDQAIIGVEQDDTVRHVLERRAQAIAALFKLPFRPLAFCDVEGFTLHQRPECLAGLVEFVFGYQSGDMLPDNLLGGETEQVFRAQVPRRDDAVGRRALDGVARGLNDRRQMPGRLFGLAGIGDVLAGTQGSDVSFLFVVEGSVVPRDEAALAFLGQDFVFRIFQRELTAGHDLREPLFCLFAPVLGNRRIEPVSPHQSVVFAPRVELRPLYGRIYRETNRQTAVFRPGVPR